MVSDDASERRRRVVVAGHRGDDNLARAHAHDPVPAVRSSALRALERIGSLTDSDLETALTDVDPSVRRTAAELAATHPLVVGLAARLEDTDTTVVEVAAWALGEAGPAAAGAAEALGQVATHHHDSLCRESATAALGAIGDPRSLPTILTALDDVAAVRRRATIALAAFDDPRADSALEACLADRDWQVRQVAEDLLDRRTGQ